MQALPGTPRPTLPWIPVDQLPALVAGEPVRAPVTLRLIDEAVPLTAVGGDGWVRLEGLPDGGEGGARGNLRSQAPHAGLAPLNVTLAWRGTVRGTLSPGPDGLVLWPATPARRLDELQALADARCDAPTEVRIPVQAPGATWTLRYTLRDGRPEEQELRDPDGGRHPFRTTASSLGDLVLQLGDVALTVTGLGSDHWPWSRLPRAAAEGRSCWLATPSGVAQCTLGAPTLERDPCPALHPPMNRFGPPPPFPAGVAGVAPAKLERESLAIGLVVGETQWRAAAGLFPRLPRTHDAKALVDADGVPRWVAIPGDLRGVWWLDAIGPSERPRPRAWSAAALDRLAAGQPGPVPFVATLRLADLEVRVSGGDAVAGATQGLDGLGTSVSIEEGWEEWFVDLLGPGGVATLTGRVLPGDDGGLAVELDSGPIATRDELFAVLEGRCRPEVDRSSARFRIEPFGVLELAGTARPLLEGSGVSIDWVEGEATGSPPRRRSLGGGAVLQLWYSGPGLGERNVDAAAAWRLSDRVIGCSLDGSPCTFVPESRGSPCAADPSR